MEAVQYKHPSDPLYKLVKLTDPVSVAGKHYAIAADIFDVRCSRVLLETINTLNRHDKATIVTFGEHTEKSTVTMDNPLRHSIVKNMLCRKEMGLNTLVGQRALEHIEADEYLIITDGCYNDAETIPHRLRLRHIATEARLIRIPMDSSPRQIRNLLGVKSSNYMDVKFKGSFGCMYVKAPPYGGCTYVRLLKGEAEPVTITYMRRDGGKYTQRCECRDDDSVPDVTTRMHGMQIEHQTFMRPCRMVE